MPPQQCYLLPRSAGRSGLAMHRQPFIWTRSESPFVSLAAAENLDGTTCLKPKLSIITLDSILLVVKPAIIPWDRVVLAEIRA